MEFCCKEHITSSVWLSSFDQYLIAVPGKIQFGIDEGKMQDGAQEKVAE
jgi:hypothetical protein